METWARHNRQSSGMAAIEGSRKRAQQCRSGRARIAVCAEGNLDVASRKCQGRGFAKVAEVAGDNNQVPSPSTVRHRHVRQLNDFDHLHTTTQLDVTLKDFVRD